MLQSDAADFRANWQRLLTSLGPLKDFTEPKERLSDPGLSTAANRAETAARSLQGHSGRAPENEPGLAEEAHLQFPTAPANSSFSRLALRIGPHNATNFSIGSASKEKSIKQKVTSPDSESKANDGDDVRSTKRKSLTLLACAQVQAAPPVALETNALHIPAQSSSQSNALFERFDTAFSDREANEVRFQTVASGPAAFGKPAGELLKEDDTPGGVPLRAHPAATADSDADFSAVAPRALRELKTEHADIPASDRSSTNDNRRLSSALLQDAVGDATVPSPPGKQNLSDPMALHSAGSRETEDRPNKASNWKAEATPARLAGVHAPSMHAAQTEPVHFRALETQVLAADAIRDSSATVGAGSSAGASTVTPSHMSSSNSAGKDLFAALDGDRPSLAPSWIRSGTHNAEAGFQDPQIGWVTVRAHAESNGVHAALVPGSMDAAESLASHLSGLSTYLANHHASVQSLTISPAEARWSEQSSAQPMDYGTAEGSRQERQSGTGAEADPNSGQSTFAAASVQRSAGIEPPAVAPRESRYISVVA